MSKFISQAILAAGKNLSNIRKGATKNRLSQIFVTAGFYKVTGIVSFAYVFLIEPYNIFSVETCIGQLIGVILDNKYYIIEIPIASRKLDIFEC